VAEDLRKKTEDWHHSWMTNAIWMDLKGAEGSTGNLTRGDISMFWFLSMWGQADGRVTASAETIAKKAGCSARAIRKNVEALIKAGWIERTMKVGRFGKFSEWRLCKFKNEKGRNHSSDPAEPQFRGGRNHSSAEVVQIQEEVALQGSRPSAERHSQQEDELEEETEEATDSADEPPWGADTTIGKDKTVLPGKRSDAPALGSEAFPAAPKVEAKKPTWPPESSSDVYWKWGEEMRERWPTFAVAKPRKLDYTRCKRLVDRHGYETLLHMIRIAIWDWTPIQQTIETWYTKNKKYPTLEHIEKIAEQLAGAVGKGVVNTSHRVSDYVTKFVRPVEVAQTPTGESFAAYHRRLEREKVEKRRAARLAREKAEREAREKHV
jgi:hypothetical protein